jgi:hypothetical protein
MKTTKSALAALEVLLVFPAVLFMTALFVRNLEPQQYEPAHSAQRIVDWYAASPRLGLWTLLIAMPLAVLLTGGFTLFRTWRHDAQLRLAASQLVTILRTQLAALLVALSTLTAGGILAIVALHVITD